MSTYRVVSIAKVSNTEAYQLPTRGKKRYHCASNCGHQLMQRSSNGTGRYGPQGKLSKIIGGAYYHTKCLPGQTWSEKLMGSVRAGAEGALVGMRRHPYTTGVALLALTGVATYAHLSKETFNILCFKDVAEKGAAWCATIAQNADPKSALYEKYMAINDWAHSGSFVTKTFDQVSGGTRFVYDTFTKFFSKNLDVTRLLQFTHWL